MNTKSIEGARRAWEVRRANAAAQSSWFRKPVCLCGCGEPLVRHGNPEKFKPIIDEARKALTSPF
jgi:hypothetical protein